MISLPEESDYRAIIVNDVPLIDVRAPVEYAAGSFNTVVNLPVLDDEDRHQVGLCYKQQGREAAFDLAFTRVSGRIKQERIDNWVKYINKHPNSIFFCFRGGMRSQTAQRWVRETTDIERPRLKGGYKRLRRFLIDSLDPENIDAIPVILGGRTGTGKTEIIHQVKNSIDLEGLAHHRGSAFGSFLTPQPTQINFENNLAFSLIKHENQKFQYILLEDEGSYVGSRSIPQELAAYFNRDSMILLERPVEERIDAVYSEYVIRSQQMFLEHFSDEDGLEHWFEDIVKKVGKIRKRLGGLRSKKVLDLMEEGNKHQVKTGSSHLHRSWVELLIKDYYDPMYDYQIEKSERKIVLQGDHEEVLSYLHHLAEQTI